MKIVLGKPTVERTYTTHRAYKEQESIETMLLWRASLAGLSVLEHDRFILIRRNKFGTKKY